MSEMFPLYPELPEAGKEEAQALLNDFKEKMKKITQEVLSNMYCDVTMFIESDSWTNFRNKIMDGFRNYGNRKLQAEYDFKEIRAQIYKEYHDEIIVELNQDLVEENEQLKKELDQERSWNRRNSI